MRRGRSGGADPSGANGHRTPGADGRESPRSLIQGIAAAAAAAAAGRRWRCEVRRRRPRNPEEEGGCGSTARGADAAAFCRAAREGEQNKAKR